MGKLIRRPKKKSRFCPVTPNRGTGEQSSSRLRNNSKIQNRFDSENSPQKCNNGSNLCSNDFKTAVAKISSEYVEDRLSALKTFASMPANKKNVKKFQDYNCIDMVSPLMSDQCTQLQATLFISKLLQANAFAVSEALVSRIFKNLCPILKSFTADDLSGNNHKMAEDCKEELTEAKIQSFIATVQILSRLCELNQTVMLRVNEEALVSYLLKFTDSREFGYPVTLAVLRCLLCVTEMNDAATDSVPTQQLIERISQIPDCDHEIYYTTLVAGVLVNVGSSDVELVTPIFNTLSHTIGKDTLAACADVSKSPNTMQAAQVESLLSAQELAMEIIANICYINDECETEPDDDYSDDMEVDSSDGNDNDDLYLVKVALQHHKIVEIVLEKAIMTFNNVENIEVMQKKLYNKVNNIKTKAVMCLVNLCSFLSCEDAGNSQILYNIFSHLGTSLLCINSKADPADEHLLRDLSVAMRTVVRNLCAGKCNLLLNVSLDDLQGIFGLSTNAVMKISISRVIGSLCCFYIDNLPETNLYSGKQNQFYQAVTNHLLQMASDSPQLPACAEALDIIIDVFSHDSTDTLAAQLDLVGRLRNIQRQFMVDVRKQRKRLGMGEHWPLIETVKDNLLNFIEHKSARIAANNKVSS